MLKNVAQQIACIPALPLLSRLLWLRGCAALALPITFVA